MDEHNRKNRNNEFTPTTTLYIGNNENPLLGKIQSFEIYDINMNTKSGGLSQGKFTKFMNTDEMSMNTGDISSSNLKLKITIDLNNMNNASLLMIITMKIFYFIEYWYTAKDGDNNSDNKR